MGRCFELFVHFSPFKTIVMLQGNTPQAKCCSALLFLLLFAVAACFVCCAVLWRAMLCCPQHNSAGRSVPACPL